MVKGGKVAGIGIYRVNRNYFTNEFSSYDLDEIKNNDKKSLGNEIGKRLKEKGIVKCVLYSSKVNGDHSLRRKTLKDIAGGLNISSNGEGRIEFKIDIADYPDINKYIKSRGVIKWPVN